MLEKPIDIDTYYNDPDFKEYILKNSGMKAVADCAWEEGYQKGLQQAQALLQIVKNMKTKGFDTATIQSLTGLDLDIIKNIE